ncbi:hypothetical protein SASPL_110110 [Salvia splendens]|uniref:Uncharacterized protein n=1 Tax=Salvia splendens TaxID=180675 RepID=A0A8X8Y478_SALSN|nr:hypothetical protein SASPL_110110 [Salvia splendens]
MEQNLPITAKKFWKIVRVLYFMLRKGISKAKLLADLSLMMKRGKIAGKAVIQNLIFHHSSAAARPIQEYEFSCGTSPSFNFPPFKRGEASRRPGADRRGAAGGGAGDDERRRGVSGASGVRTEPDGAAAADHGFAVPAV